MKAGNYADGMVDPGMPSKADFRGLGFEVRLYLCIVTRSCNNITVALAFLRR
jgi:hypothetical protein